MLHSRRDGDRQDGQIIVLFELCLVVILACAALVIDLGLLRNNKQILVNTLDSAALAGASVLPVDGQTEAVTANGLINANIQANFPGLRLGTDYKITYRCLVGADPVTGAPLISRDVPAMCDPRPSLGIVAPALPPSSAFTGAGPRRISACDPVTHADKCNVVVIEGSETTPYSIAPVVGVTSGSTGTIVSAACNGSLCGQVIAAPVDLVIILDRTRSMSDNYNQHNENPNGVKIHDLQDAAKAVLGVYDPAKQRVALALTGPSVVDANGNASLGSCPDGGTAVGTATNDNFFPHTTLSGATTTLGSAATTLNAPTTNLGGPLTKITVAMTTSSSNNTITVPAGGKTGFPAGTGWAILVDNEQMTVTVNDPASTTWTVTRTARVAHSINAPVSTPNYINASTTTTTINVTSADGFPPSASGDYSIQIDSEQMLVTGGKGTTTWTVRRGQGGTTAAAHSSGETAILVITNASTTIAVAATTTGFPTVFPFTVKIDNEQMSVEGSPSGTLWTVLRGQGGTAPALHNNQKAVSWDVDNADTKIYVASITGFPTPPPNFTIQVDNEQMTVSVVEGSSAPYTLTVARGANNTAAAAHNGGKAVAMVVGKADTAIIVDKALGIPVTGSFRIVVDRNASSEEQMQATVWSTTTSTIVLGVTRGGNPQQHVSGASVMDLDGWTPAVTAASVTPVVTTAGVWVPVGLSGTDTTPDAPPAYNPGGTGGDYHTTTSPIVKAINCISAISSGTTLAQPLAFARWYLDTYGRPGVVKGILVETDGHPEDGQSLGLDALQFTCGAAVAEAQKAKDEGIKIYSVGYGVVASCQSRSDNSSETVAWAGKSATSLLQAVATGPNPPYYFNSPLGSDLAKNFQAVAADLVHSGAQLIQLYPTPIVTGVSGTTTITILGHYFTGADLVTFGGTPAAAGGTVTDTSITVTTLPAGCHGPVNVVVRTPTGGSSAITSDSKYTCP